jgi:hypothetical protein
MKQNHGFAIKSILLLSLLVNFQLIFDRSELSWLFDVGDSINSIKNKTLDKRPPQMTEITITNYGWYHPNPEEGLKTPRCMAIRRFNDAIVAHERYNESAWRDLNENPDPERPIIAFLDIDTCRHLHWPKFHGDWEINSDREYDRTPMSTWNEVFQKDCIIIENALHSPALASPNSRLVVLSCHEDGPGSIPCLRIDRNDSGSYSKLVVGHLSAHKNFTYPYDFGLPPWPVKYVALSQEQKDDIRMCRESSRRLLFSFNGRWREPFPQFHEYFEPLHGKDGIHAVFQYSHYENLTKNAWGYGIVENEGPVDQIKDLYYQLLTTSHFIGTPLGDCLYSVRFSEVLSAGAIPVVYSDGWVLPFNKDIVNWSDLAVILPQREVNSTLTVLRSISKKKRCDMRRRGFEFFQKYLAHSSGRLRAILELVEQSLAKSPRTALSSAPE